jgi:hypothetical protein
MARSTSRSVRSRNALSREFRKKLALADAGGHRAAIYTLINAARHQPAR